MLNYDARARIARDVILGLPAPPDEPDEAKAFRAAVAKDKAAADQAGVMLDLPFDWENNNQ